MNRFSQPSSRAGWTTHQACRITASLALATLTSVAGIAHAGDRTSRPTSCPYQFSSSMPADTFCVYRGVARGKGGEICDSDLVIIWSTFGGIDEARAGIYLGLIDDPEVVVHATVDQRPERAAMVEYSVGESETAQPLTGEVALHSPRPGKTTDTLSLQLAPGAHLQTAAGCRFDEYSGSFMGMISPPLATARSY